MKFSACTNALYSVRMKCGMPRSVQPTKIAKVSLKLSGLSTLWTMWRSYYRTGVNSRIQGHVLDMSSVLTRRMWNHHGPLLRRFNLAVREISTIARPLGEVRKWANLNHPGRQCAVRATSGWSRLVLARSTCPTDIVRKGVVLGIYFDEENHFNPYGKLSDTAVKFNERVCGRLEELLFVAGLPIKKGQHITLFDLDPDIQATVVVGLGSSCSGYDTAERMDESKEAIREAAAIGCQELQRLRTKIIYVESFGHAESAAEGASLGSWIYQENKNKKHRLLIPDLILYEDCDWTGWQIGLQKAAAQNLARQFTETPANLLTPTEFALKAVEVLCKSNVNVEVKVKSWTETLNMNAFMAVAKGSCEPLVFLEISYYGTQRDDRPIVLIGKGLTFNSGGLNLKNIDKLRLMRGDMAGAAIVVAVCRAISSLGLPLNVRGLIPLCENMPGCSAMHSGDIVHAMNGKSIHVDSTDHAGRLILADALVYAQTFWPRFILDVGTMTRDTEMALSAGATAVFTNSETLWEYMEAASMHTGDRVWRFPLWDHFRKFITAYKNVDLTTEGIGHGNTCKLAMFLKEFVPCGEWIHLDTFGVNYETLSDPRYLRKGMTGRPTRTIIEFISQMVCQHKDDKKC